MNKNIIQFIVDEKYDYISPIPVGRVKATSNLTTRIQLVTPITASVAVNYVIYDSKNIQKKQYLIPSADLGSAVVDPNNPNYQLVAGWKVYEADIYAPILSVISRFRTGKVGMSFEFVEQVPNALCTNHRGYFGVPRELPENNFEVTELPEIASNGDYYICADYNFRIDENLYNKGDILVWYGDKWRNGGLLEKGSTGTEDISVDPAISYPTEEEEEVYKTAFGNAIGEIGDDVAELDIRLNGVETNLNGKQDKVDLLLNTASKTVVGGINEVKTQEEAHYNALNTNKLDKNFNLLVERTFSQLTDWVAVRSGSDTLKMSLETLRTYLTQGLVGLSFVLVDEPPPTGVLGVIYLTPTVSNVERVATFEELPALGAEDTIYIVEADNSRYQWNVDLAEYEAYNQGYEEWVWLEELEKYELIGTTKIDLSGYATETWVTENFTTKSEFSGLVESLNGGTTGQVLAKKSDSDLDVEWTDIETPTISVNGINYLHDPEKTYVVIKTPADNDTFTLLTGTTGTPNYTIEWGDGTSESVTTTDNIEHTYATAGMYLITISDTISGTFTNGIVVGIASNPNKVKYIDVYGGTNYPTSISASTFQNCTKLTTVHLPLVTSIASTAFINCTKLTTVHLPLVTSINIEAFRNCTSLTTVHLPLVTSINASAFQSCTSLKELTIGNVTTVATGSRFTSVVLDKLTISGNISDTDIERILTFYSDNGGTFSNSYELKHGLQIEKTPVADNDVVRKFDLDAVKNLIPTQVNRYFTEETQTLFTKPFYTMQPEKPVDPIANIDLTITATTQANAQVIARFTTLDGIPNAIDFTPQNTEVLIQAVKTAGTQNIRLFSQGHVMDDLGNETLLSTSNIVTLTTNSENYSLFMPLPEYTAPIGSRAVIEILAFRVSGSGTHTARIRVNDDTMSKWSYNLSLADLNLDAENITYNNASSGLTATNVQDALDELDNKIDNKIDKADIVTTISGTPSDTKVASESAVASAVITRENILTTDLEITTSYQPLVLSEDVPLNSFLEFYFVGVFDGTPNKMFSESTKLRVILTSNDELQTHLIIDGIIVTINLFFGDGPYLTIKQTNLPAGWQLYLFKIYKSTLY